MDGRGEPAPGGEQARIVHRNIDSLMALRRRQEAQRSRGQRFVDAVTWFTGSAWSLWAHIGLFGGWLLLNSGVLPWPRAWDPFPFVMLAMAASVEAIFLSTFVLITQNRMQGMAERRADLDLQVSLLAEHEVSRLLTLVDAIATRLGVEEAGAPDLEDLKKDAAPDKLLEEIEEAEHRP